MDSEYLSVVDAGIMLGVRARQLCALGLQHRIDFACRVEEVLIRWSGERDRVGGDLWHTLPRFTGLLHPLPENKIDLTAKELLTMVEAHPVADLANGCHEGYVRRVEEVTPPNAAHGPRTGTVLGFMGADDFVRQALPIRLEQLQLTHRAARRLAEAAGLDLQSLGAPPPGLTLPDGLDMATIIAVLNVESRDHAPEIVAALRVYRDFHGNGRSEGQADSTRETVIDALEARGVRPDSAKRLAIVANPEWRKDRFRPKGNRKRRR